jgi:hypothetical protein
MKLEDVRDMLSYAEIYTHSHIYFRKSVFPYYNLSIKCPCTNPKELSLVFQIEKVSGLESMIGKNLLRLELG